MAEIRYNRFYSDCREVVLAVLKTCIVQFKGADNFIVYEGIPEVKKANQLFNYIYFYRADGSQSEMLTAGCLRSRDYIFRVGIMRKCGNVDPLLDARYFEQLDNLSYQFGPFYQQTVYSFTFQSEVITNLADIGIKDITRTPDLQFKNGNVEGVEFGVNFKIYYRQENLKAIA